MDAKDRIIVALDVGNARDALALVTKLHKDVGMFKIGLELLYSILAPIVSSEISDKEAEKRMSHARILFGLLEGKIFLDGKFHDIPNTVSGAAAPLSKQLNVAMFNIHASGGIDMMKRAVVHRNGAKILAVTVLTSLDEEACHAIYGAPSKAKVVQFARDAALAGVDGIVCSPQELEVLGKHPELSNLLKVTPGVRPEWAAIGDQRRVMTPGEAVKSGADYLVIGRPITQPPAGIGTPVDAAHRIAEEIAAVL